MKKFYFVGIDPGMASGAISIIERDIFGNDSVLFCEDIPLIYETNGKLKIDFKRFHGMLFLWKRHIVHCTFEYVSAMPNQNIQSMFRFGGGYFGIQSVFDILDIPMTFVTSSVWKKFYGLKKSKNTTTPQFKSMSRALASRLYPDVDLSKVKDSDRAESLLISRYGLYIRGHIKK